MREALLWGTHIVVNCYCYGGLSLAMKLLRFTTMFGRTTVKLLFLRVLRNSNRFEPADMLRSEHQLQFPAEQVAARAQPPRIVQQI